MIRQEGLKVETFILEEATEEVGILAQMHEVLRSRTVEIRQVIRQEQNRLRTQDLERMPTFDLTEDLEWLQEFGMIERIPSPRRRYANYAEELEPLFQNGLMTRLGARPEGTRWTWRETQSSRIR
jgi:hypothetical protein